VCPSKRTPLASGTNRPACGIDTGVARLYRQRMAYRIITACKVRGLTIEIDRFIPARASRCPLSRQKVAICSA
jgi:hypothetical protein